MSGASWMSAWWRERQRWMNWNPPTWCPESEFSALCLLVKSGFNLSCLVCAADQYQLYYKWSGAKPMCTVSTCTWMGWVWNYCCLFTSERNTLRVTESVSEPTLLILYINSKWRIIVLSFDRKVDLRISLYVLWQLDRREWRVWRSRMWRNKINK